MRDANAVREFVLEHLRDERAVLVADETGTRKGHTVGRRGLRRQPKAAAGALVIAAVSRIPVIVRREVVGTTKGHNRQCELISKVADGRER
jgi:SRSO17 transposase